MSRNIQFVLMGFYLLLSLSAIFEKNYAKGLYWFGAIILSCGVLLMK